MEYNLQMLEELYMIRSTSFNEVDLANYVKQWLTEYGIHFEEDEYGNIFKLYEDSALLSAHMDEVTVKKCKRVKFNATKTKVNGHQGALGCDDKNGVWILLHILNEAEFKNKVSFCFSVCEEIGGYANKVAEAHPKKMSSIRYGLVFDRKGGNDIIGQQTFYASPEFMADLQPYMDAFAYKEEKGLFCDADLFSAYFPCINISVGYYNAHTSHDYTKLPEMYKALNFGMEVLRNLTDIYPVNKWATEGISLFGYKKTEFGLGSDEGYWEEIERDYEAEHSCVVDVPCPECGEDKMIIESPYTIGDSQCCKCGAVFEDSDGTVHFAESWTYGDSEMNDIPF
jgi:hypothetical protein